MLKATEEGDQIRAVNIGSVESQLLPYIVYGQTHYIEVPDSPGRIYDESLEEILAAILKCIPECISEADFKRLPAAAAARSMFGRDQCTAVGYNNCDSTEPVLPFTISSRLLKNTSISHTECG